jgi:putative addiction module component (TIGR02574 family)
MSRDFEVLKAEALRLSPADREDLLDLLFASLDTDPGAAAEWDAIADVRERELRSGVVQAVPLEDVMARLEAQYPDEGRASSLG